VGPKNLAGLKLILAPLCRISHNSILFICINRPFYFTHAEHENINRSRLLNTHHRQKEETMIELENHSRVIGFPMYSCLSILYHHLVVHYDSPFNQAMLGNLFNFI